MQPACNRTRSAKTSPLNAGFFVPAADRYRPLMAATHNFFAFRSVPTSDHTFCLSRFRRIFNRCLHSYHLAYNKVLTITF
ncbi:hypothetical protein HA48_12825 [Pantoea wallisii]|uniref:Uncharacterized protein n=1 Tax=Pantoea wallisii TaxID=1076551 RepID=A0A1X1D826_9GAMM|nr:hypothetical protein HA48_12825 [Pantoea wallisii]